MELEFRTSKAACGSTRHELRSWQQIAKYVGKGIRTVQRWERDMNFPVHRPTPESKQKLVAFTDEIDAWLRGSTPQRADSQDQLARLSNLVERMTLQTSAMQSLVEQLRAKQPAMFEVIRERSAAEK